MHNIYHIIKTRIGVASLPGGLIGNKKSQEKQIMWNRPWFKKLAKEQLHANLGNIIVIMLIYLGISLAGSIVLWIAMIGSAIFDGVFRSFGLVTGTVVFLCEIVVIGAIAPMVLGLSKIALSLTHGQSPVPSDIFYAYRDPQLMWTAVRLIFLQAIYTFLWSLLLLIPGIVKAYAYSQSFTVLADHPEMTASECIRESMRLTDGHKFDLFVLNLSFILWGLVSAVPIVGYLAMIFYVEPYILITSANTYRFMVDEKSGGDVYIN
jgi:uncharacterized membrane protein